MVEGPLTPLVADLSRRRIVRYGLALAIVAAATVCRGAVDPLVHDQIPYFIYVAAVVVASWSCGADGGALATFLAAFVGNYFFVEPRYQIIPHPDDLVAMTLFSVVALGLVALVSRWKRAEAELRDRAARMQALADEAERANRVKDEFLATLSHELRTPLNAIVGWAQLLRNGRLDRDRQRQAVETIARNAEAQTRLVEDILDVSRIVNGKLRLNVAPVDVSALVDSAVEAIRPAADARQIVLDMTLSASPLTVNGDADRLQQIVWNLLSNAVKFTPEHGRVMVTVEKDGSHAVIRVSDTGIGIDRDFLPFLFEHFSQRDGSTTRQHGGLGLGLAIVRHLVELHGGTVHAASDGEDRGATFAVTLPLRTARTVHAPMSRTSATGVTSLAGIRVLVVDDEPDARDLVTAALTDLGAVVQTAASAQEALPVVRAWRPDVLLADIGMPSEDGYSLLRQVRSLSPGDGGLTPAVALTAYGSADDRLRALYAGYQLHIAKPALPGQIAAAVADLAMTRAG